MNNLRRLEPYFIFFGSLILFLYGMFGRELVGFETRFALFAKEMLQNGFSIFPTTYGAPYPDYPSGLTVLNVLFALVFGKISTFTSILPSALASSSTLVLIYFIALPTSREWGRIAVLLTLFTYEFFDAARTLSMDPLLMLACTWAAYAVYRQEGSFKIFLPLIFGFCIRGPIGLILPAGTVVAFLLAQKDWHALKTFALRALGLLVILMITLLFAAASQGGTHFVHDVLIMQIFGRLSDHRTHDFFAYFTQSFVNYALSFELAMASMILLWSSCKNELLFRACLYWALIILIGMSIPEVRKIRYVMSMTPALALLGARFWIEASKQRSAKITLDIFHGLCLALPFIFIVLTIATILVTHLKNLNVNAHYFSAFCTLGLFSLGSIYIFFHHPIEYALRNPKKVIGIGLASFCAVIIFVIQPIEVSLNRVKPFVNDVLNAKNPTESITFFQVDKDAEPIQFMSGVSTPLKINFTDQLESTPTLYITQAKIFDNLPDEEKQKLTVVLREKLGHKEMVVFRLATT